MKNLPQEVWEDLVNPGGDLPALQFVVLYELALDAGTLRYSSADVTWNSNAYTAQAIAQDDVSDDIAKIGQSSAITLSNVNNTLRAQLTPADLITGKEITCRLVTYDAPGGTLNTYSTILFKGKMEHPSEVDENKIRIPLVDVINAAGAMFPRRKTQHYCPFDFANGDTYDGAGFCQYQQNTLANGAGVSSTSLVCDDVSLMVAKGSETQAGRLITIGGGAAVAIDSVNNGTKTITLAEARSWSDNDPVRFVDCNREIDDCFARGNEQNFGGFPGVSHFTRYGSASGRFDPTFELL